jgi:hypothetical protein
MQPLPLQPVPLQPQRKQVRQQGRALASSPRGQPGRGLAAAAARRSGAITNTGSPIPQTYAATGGGSCVISPRRSGDSNSPPRPSMAVQASSALMRSASGGSPRGAYHWIAPRHSTAQQQQDLSGVRGRSRPSAPGHSPGPSAKPQGRGVPMRKPVLPQ